MFLSKTVVIEGKDENGNSYSLDRYELDTKDFPWRSLIEQLDPYPRVGTNRFGTPSYARRSVGFFSDVVKYYKLAKLADSSIAARPLTDELRVIMRLVNDHLKETYNGIIVNYYRDGRDSISAHSDNPLANGKYGVATISFGGTRTFRIRRIDKPEEIFYDLDAHHEDMVVMTGVFQRLFTHEVPEQFRMKEPRLSLTFRCVPLEE